MNSFWEDLPAGLRDNPFFHFSEETNFVPAWDRIKPEHVKPAFDYAFALATKNIESIRSNKRPPTFQNTVEALERASELIDYFYGVLGNICPNTKAGKKAYDALDKQIAARYASLWQDVFTDKALYRRFKAIEASPQYESLSQERGFLCDIYINAFVDSGVNLSPEKQAKLIETEKRVLALGIESQKNMQKAAESVLVFDDIKELAGLSEYMLASAANLAAERGYAGKWAFNLEELTSYRPFMESVHNRSLREKMWKAYHTQASKGPYDNRSIILELAKLIRQASQIQGYRNLAHSTLMEQMAETSSTTSNFIHTIKRKALAKTKEDLQVLQQYALKTDGVKKLEPWDIDYYESRIKKKVLGFDEEELRPYFEVDAVLDGLFSHFGKQLQIEFEETDEYPTYHEDVRVFKVSQKSSGKHLGVLFLDLYDRKFKPAGTAWCCPVLSQGLFDGKVRRPIDVVLTKFKKGENGNPTLLRHDDVWVLIHELGHAVHELSSECRYRTFGGMSTETDFVEFPSQFQESFCFEPSILGNFAFHHETGEPIPDDFKSGIENKRKLFGARKELRYARRSWLDLQWSRANLDDVNDVRAFEEKHTKTFRAIPAPGSLKSPRFSHLFGGGYECQYYSYQWSLVMAHDAFKRFKQRGLYDRSLCAKYRAALRKGGSEWGATLYKSLMNRDPIMGPYLKAEGLTSGAFNHQAANSNFVSDPTRSKRKRAARFSFLGRRNALFPGI